MDETDEHGEQRDAGTTLLELVVREIEDADRWDAVAEALGRWTAPLEDAPAGRALRGEWLGHALHPLLTDFPLGCWLSAGLLDLLGGRAARPAARRLVGLGLVATVPTVAAGLAEFPGL